ncbi:hypothetical protein BDZ89DRAFT_1159545 [Hymenopellis radicata]|nr:hypothetical protein BDZ89DRAFT_1159545 [Hymenopellis radicata]
MVKREPYPVFHDESQFFTVNQPYPLNFEWEKPAEVLKFAHWIAACLGTHRPFWNFYFKPKAAFILLEIEKRADGEWMRKILGEHKWKKILANPSKEEQSGYSQIFPCALSIADVRKSGWRSYEIKPEWFEGWAPEKEFKVNPYPTPDFCEPPREDITGLPLCRKLPKAFRPPPVVAPKPAVPGSAEWANDRSATPVRGNGRGRGRGARGRGNGRGNSNTKPARAWDQPLVQAGAKQSTTTSPPPQNVRVASSTPSAWENPDQAANIQLSISNNQSTITMLGEDGEQLEASTSVGIAMQMADKHVTPVNQPGPISPASRRKATKEQSRLRNTEDDQAVPPDPSTIVTLDGSVHANPLVTTKSAWAKGPPTNLKNGPPGLVHPSRAKQQASSSAVTGVSAQLSRIVIAEEDDEPDVALGDQTTSASTIWASDAPSYWMGGAGYTNPTHVIVCKAAICDTYSKQLRNWKKEYRKRHNGEDPPLKPGPYNVKVAEREAAKQKKILDAEKKEQKQKKQKEREQHEKEKAALEKLEETRRKAMEENERWEMEAERERKPSKPWDEYEDEDSFGSDPAEEITGGGKKDEGHQQSWKKEAVSEQGEEEEEEPW